MAEYKHLKNRTLHKNLTDDYSAFPLGGASKKKSPSAGWQRSICYSKPVVCFDHFPDVRKMIISILVVEF